MLSLLSDLSGKSRIATIAVVVALFLAVMNFEIASKEKTIDNGTPMLLRLAPRDPRSLLQGDYMALRYSLANEIARTIDQESSRDGAIVVKLGELNEALLVRIHGGEPLSQGEYLLRFRKRGESVRLASDAYFFQEGSGDLYANGRFGEVRVDTGGDAVLVGLRGSDGEPLGVQLH